MSELLIRELGCVDYTTAFENMQHFTKHRDAQTPDQLWVVAHPSVYTLGQAGKLSHILRRNDIPVVQVDRGGQVTYHGPGQIIVYLLLDLHRRKLFVRELVSRMEDALIMTLASFGIEGVRNPGAPGVYVHRESERLAKIAALGIKVTRGMTYHGLALNVEMDLTPFHDINPCGYAGLETVDMKSVCEHTLDLHLVKQQLLSDLTHCLHL